MIPEVWVRPVLGLTLKERLYTDGREEDWLLGSLTLPLSWQGDYDFRWNLFGEYLVGQDLNTLELGDEGSFQRLTFSTSLRREIGERWQVQGRGMLAYLHGEAPLDKRPYLGGVWMRGHVLGDLVGQEVQALSLGFEWSAIPDLLMAGLFVDMGHLVEEEKVAFDTGLLCNIHTPMGPLSISYGSPVDEWNPVWNLSFQVDW